MDLLRPYTYTQCLCHLILTYCLHVSLIGGGNVKNDKTTWIGLVLNWLYFLICRKKRLLTTWFTCYPLLPSLVQNTKKFFILLCVKRVHVNLVRGLNWYTVGILFSYYNLPILICFIGKVSVNLLWSLVPIFLLGFIHL